MGTDKRVISLRDVLVKGLRDIAVQIASVDLSDAEPTTEQVTQFVQTLQIELDKARARGVVVPPNVSVYTNPHMLVAANREALSCMRLRLADGSEVLFSPPPAAYVMGSVAEEIERAAGEAATPTDVAPKPERHESACSCPQCQIDRQNLAQSLARPITEQELPVMDAYKPPPFTSGMPAHGQGCQCRECTHGFNLSAGST
jgi:hypothetical protein